MSEIKIYAMIPARFRSTRLKMKNLALIAGKPMISYAITAAKEAGVFNKIFINSENIIFKKIADQNKINFYHRPEELGSSLAKSNSVITDFMQKHPEADIVVWVNPIAPFQTGTEILDIVDYFLNNSLDSLITTEEKQVHCNFMNEPVNYQLEGDFAQTQDLIPVQTFVYSLMMWRSKTFFSSDDGKSESLFCGKFDVYSVKKETAIIVKTPNDLKIADLLMQSIDKVGDNYKVNYLEL
jgi:CMP-N-acetylneuraminic acid synthetase